MNSVNIEIKIVKGYTPTLAVIKELLDDLIIDGIIPEDYKFEDPGSDTLIRLEDIPIPKSGDAMDIVRQIEPRCEALGIAYKSITLSRREKV